MLSKEDKFGRGEGQDWKFLTKIEINID